MEEDAPYKDEYVEVCEDDAEVLSDGRMGSDGDEGPSHSPIRNTLSGVSHIFSTHKGTDVESNHKEKVQPAQLKRCQPSPKEDMPSKESEESSSKEEQATTTRPGTGPGVWTQTLMPGSTRRLQKVFLAGHQRHHDVQPSQAQEGTTESPGPSGAALGVHV